MLKEYLLANIRISDKEKFQKFSGIATPIIKEYGGIVLARGQNASWYGGSLSGTVMMIEFESVDAAETFYHSDEYQLAKTIRGACSNADLMIIERT